MIELCHVTGGYGKKEVIKDISLQVAQGSVVTIVGHNGCGKSTLLQTMLGFLPCKQGEIRLNGLSVPKASPKEIAKTAAYLPQMRRPADISVGRLVLHGRFPYLHYPRTYRKEDYAIVRSAMEQMGILDLEDRPMEELSGGMQQKAYIAMALAQQTPIIVMDEPTAFLDVGQQIRLMQLVRELAAQGKTLVLVLHDLHLALRYSDQIAVMENGMLKAMAAPEEIVASRVLQQLFSVEIGKVETAQGIQYYYAPQEGET